MKCTASQLPSPCSVVAERWQEILPSTCLMTCSIIFFQLSCVRAKLLQSCPSLCDPMNHGLPGSSVHGILQARILEWVAVSYSRGSSQPRGQTHVSCVSCIAGGFFTPEPPGKPNLFLLQHFCSCFSTLEEYILQRRNTFVPFPAN